MTDRRFIEVTEQQAEDWVNDNFDRHDDGSLTAPRSTPRPPLGGQRVDRPRRERPNLKHLLRLPLGERWDAYTRLAADGKITVDDVARNENMNPPKIADVSDRPPKPPTKRCQKCSDPVMYPGKDWSEFCANHSRDTDDPAALAVMTSMENPSTLLVGPMTRVEHPFDLVYRLHEDGAIDENEAGDLCMALARAARSTSRALDVTRLFRAIERTSGFGRDMDYASRLASEYERLEST
jgi:hypothetical protein